MDKSKGLKYKFSSEVSSVKKTEAGRECLPGDETLSGEKNIKFVYQREMLSLFNFSPFVCTYHSTKNPTREYSVDTL